MQIETSATTISATKTPLYFAHVPLPCDGGGDVDAVDVGPAEVSLRATGSSVGRAGAVAGALAAGLLRVGALCAKSGSCNEHAVLSG
jgi:hypothetical protein